MDNQVFIHILITQVILIVALIISVVYLIRQSRVFKLEERFESFSLLSNTINEKSIFDHLTIKLWKYIHRFSVLLKKSVFLKKYSKRYEKHITVEEKSFKSGLDYVSVKFLVAIIAVILNTITIMFQHLETSFIQYLITFIIGFYLPDIFLTIEFKRKRKKIEEDLLRAIIIMNNSFKSGKNIMQAIETVKTELEGPIRDEFKKIHLDMTYGLSLDVVFKRFYERVKLKDAKYIASSLTLLNKTGGNIVRVFSTIEKSVFDKKKLRNELNSLTAASVFVFRVLVALPFIFSLIIYILNPTYFEPLFSSVLGMFFLILIIALFSLYIFAIKKVLKVKV